MTEPKTALASAADLDDIESVPFETRMPFRSIYEALNHAAAAHAERPAVSFQLKGDPKGKVFSYTYADYIREIRRVANMLRAHGVDDDTPVATLLPNLPETLFSMMGGLIAGRMAPINALMESSQIAAILRESGAKVLVTLAPMPKTDIHERAAAALADAPGVETVIEIDLSRYLTPPLSWIIPLIRPKRVDGHGARVISYHTESQAQPSDRLTFEPSRDMDRVAAYFHTGGTTGDPKLAQHHMGGILYMAWCVESIAYQDGDVILCALPLFHVFGAYAIAMAAPRCGGHVVLASPAGFRGEGVVDNFWKLTERYKANFLYVVPTAISALNQRPVNADVSSLRYAISGSAALPPDTFREFEEKTGLKLLEGYGQTETICVISCNPPMGDCKIGSVGLRLPYSEVAIAQIGADDSWVAECATDEIGEILAHGPHVFPGYSNPDRNVGVFVEAPDGRMWLRTGDLGRIDSDEYLWVTGRVKDVIIRGGHNIDPGMIEDAAAGHPAVAFSGAIGQPDAHAGELPCLYVEVNAGATATADELKAFVSERVGERAARPVHVEIVDELPKTAVGKVFKPDLRMRAAERVLSAALAEAGLGATVRCVKDSTRGVMAETTPAQGDSPEQIAEVLGRFAVAWRIADQS